MKYGYARVSTGKQSLDRQIDSLRSYNVDYIYSDKYTGTRIDRPNYCKLKAPIKKGDELYIHALDRLGRNKQLIKDEIRFFQEKGVIIRILNMPTTMIELDGQEWIIEMINNIILEVLSSLAQQEHDMMVERTVEGLKAARKRGKSIGRPTVSIEEVDNLVRQGVSITEACKQCNVSRATYYKHRA